jgi:hypothetical protein
MQIEYMHAMLTGVWMLFIAALGYATGITSLVGLTALRCGADTSGNHDALLGCTGSDDV